MRGKGGETDRQRERGKKMPFCCVANCQNGNRGTKKGPDGIVYHMFPRNVRLRKLWERRCSYSGKLNAKTARVCSVHFESGDYVRDVKNELLAMPTRKALKKDAVPSLNLGSEKNSRKRNRTERARNREHVKKTKKLTRRRPANNHQNAGKLLLLLAVSFWKKKKSREYFKFLEGMEEVERA